MIWVRGEIVEDQALRVSALDRTFEHGLGLFETFRTWNGRATLLDRHLARLLRSAEVLGLPLDPAHLPDQCAISDLRSAEGRTGDSAVRITMSGGTADAGSATVWVRTSALPFGSLLGPGDLPFLAVASSGLGTDWNSRLGRHKTLNYWSRQLEFERQGGREAAITAPDGALIEGTRTNVFYLIGRTLRTAATTYPILPGIMRGVVLERARDLGMDVEEFDPSGLGGSPAERADWRSADEMFLTNSVRGVVPVPRVQLGIEMPAPGPLTERLWRDVRDRLKRGEIEP